jgi:hypothetical protein
MPTLFTVSNILYVINSIEELLYMSESPPRPEISYATNLIKIYFPLKNGRAEVKIGSQEYSFLDYIDDNETTLKSIQFTNDAITDTDGSFHKAFRGIRSFDREYSSQTKVISTSLDRASFGLTKEN